MKLTISTKIYFLLVIILAFFSSINTFLPQGSLTGQYELPASKPILAIAAFFIMLVVYGGSGFVGLILSNKLGFAEIWDEKINNKHRFIIPASVGVCIGIFFIIADILFRQFHTLGALPHPAFPASIVTSITAGIGEEIMFRLLFISSWMWLLSFIIFIKKWQKHFFWIIAVFSALGFALGHLPSVMTSFGLASISEVPIPLMVEILLLNGVLSLFSANYFRKYGFLAAVGIHFWTDIVWHVIYGLI
jgi:hypothetical protein